MATSPDATGHESQVHPISDATPFRLLSLPKEIRLRIYQWVFHEPDGNGVVLTSRCRHLKSIYNCEHTVSERQSKALKSTLHQLRWRLRQGTPRDLWDLFCAITRCKARQAKKLDRHCRCRRCRPVACTGCRTACIGPAPLQGRAASIKGLMALMLTCKSM